MKIEFIIEGDLYKKNVMDLVPAQKDGFTLITQNRKVDGVNNYVLSVEINNKSVGSAKVLSNVSKQIIEKLSILECKYYKLIDEPSTFFAEKLYPFLTKFETKLRKFVYLALFDIDDEAEKNVINKFKKTKSEFKGIDNIPKNNFLETLTLGNMFDFLFDNFDFIDQAKKKTNSIVNDIDRTATKSELLKIINEIDEKTIWNIMFADRFSSFSLPKYHRQLIEIRNDVMHFHEITYEKYKNAYKLLKTINEELDEQLNKEIVLETTNENKDIILSTYCRSVMDEIVQSVNLVGQLFSNEAINTYANLISSLQEFYNNRFQEISSSIGDLIGLNGLFEDKKYIVNEEDEELKSNEHDSDEDIVN